MVPRRCRRAILSSRSLVSAAVMAPSSYMYRTRSAMVSQHSWVEMCLVRMVTRPGATWLVVVAV